MFRFKPMPLYVRNVIEPIVKAAHNWIRADNTNIRNTMQANYQELTESIHTTNVNLENLHTKLVTQYMPLKGGSFIGVVNELWVDLDTSGEMDLSKANFFSKDCAKGGNTFSFLNVPEAPNALTVSLILKNAAGKTFTWPSGVVWNGGDPPDIENTGIVTFFVLGGSTIFGWHSFSA